MLEPLRETVARAQETYRQAAEEAQSRDALRRDLDRAVASVHNVETAPRPTTTVLNPKVAMRMTEQEWAAVRERAAAGEVILPG
jgi:hypothetical protein